MKPISMLHLQLTSLGACGRSRVQNGYLQVYQLVFTLAALLSWRLALGARRLEHARRHTFGAILVVVLEKQSKNLG
jgi:hypothetical protein